MLAAIVIAAEIFTNALEHLGQKLRISEGVTGSLFAAVGTALPETIVPILAITNGSSHGHLNEEIGVGAILGAPLMLSTLSICLMGMAVLKTRSSSGYLRPEHTGLTRDLNTFLIAYTFATLALFLPSPSARSIICCLLIVLYFIYILLTVQASNRLVAQGHITEAQTPMILQRIGMPVNGLTLFLQLSLGLGLLVAGAKGFILGVENASQWLNITPLLLSLIIIPIATELPEKINSILWIRKGKDTLAFGNITGAMVFQGTLLPAIGISLTPWVPRTEVFAAIVLTLLATIWLRLMVIHTLRVWHLIINGILYLCYLAINLW